MNRARIRDLGVVIGSFPPGKYNAITDVPGVLVGHATLVYDQPAVVRSGVTMIIPRESGIGNDYAFAGFHRFNGCGEMTGVQWLEETGMLTSAIGLTNTRDVGMLRDAMAEYSYTHGQYGPFFLPVATETYDGWLNDMGARSLTREHVFQAFENAKSGPVDEGDVGGGTGMICHEFKGGIGTSSRRLPAKLGGYTVGVLVQTNFGGVLTIAGAPVGQELGRYYLRNELGMLALPERNQADGSCMIVIATDAPVRARNLKRMAARAIMGMARTGAAGSNGSGDYAIAFSTAPGVRISTREEMAPRRIEVLPNEAMSPLFLAVIEATEEAIYNSLFRATTMTGQGHTVEALPIAPTVEILKKYGAIR